MDKEKMTTFTIILKKHKRQIGCRAKYLFQVVLVVCRIM